MNARTRKWLYWVLFPALLLGLFVLPRSCGSALIGNEAPSFALRIVSGEGAAAGDRVRIDDLRGKVVVLDFWASWCPPCRKSVPILNRIAGEFRDRVVLLGVNVEPELGPTDVAAAHRVFGGHYPTVHDRDGTVQNAYGVTQLPTFVLLDRNGVVRDVGVGVPTEEHLREIIRSALRP